MELRDRWFDDYEVGETFEVAGSHVMDGDRMVAFAQEFDPQPFHTDPAAAADTIYGGLIASGWHSAAVLMKLLATTLGPASLGSPGCRELRWLAPVRPGAELRLRIRVEDKVPSRSKPDRGVLTYRNELYDQTGQVVLSLESAMLLRRRPESA